MFSNLFQRFLNRWKVVISNFWTWLEKEVWEYSVLLWVLITVWGRWLFPHLPVLKTLHRLLFCKEQLSRAFVTDLWCSPLPGKPMDSLVLHSLLQLSALSFAEPSSVPFLPLEICIFINSLPPEAIWNRAELSGSPNSHPIKSTTLRHWFKTPQNV